MLSLITRTQALIDYMPGYTAYQDGNSTDIVYITRTDGDKSAPNFALLESRNDQVFVLHFRHGIDRDGTKVFRPQVTGERSQFQIVRANFTGSEAAQAVEALHQAIKYQHNSDLAWLAEQPAE
jgi:hypothetical protein